jgi:ATP-dependent RNA helicase RhlE
MGYVINYELPNIPETYVHRIGRTGRAGANGIAISFCDDEEKEYLRDIQKLVNKKIPTVRGHVFDVPLMHENDLKAKHPLHTAPAKNNRNKRQNRFFARKD